MTGRTLTARSRAKATCDETSAEENPSGANNSDMGSQDQALKVMDRPATDVALAGTITKDHSPSAKGKNLQDQFLNLLRKNKTPVTMFLVKGVKLQGIITWFDNFSILLRRDGQSQLVYKHAISTIMPSQPIDVRVFAVASDIGKKGRLLQDIFLASARDAGVHVTMFLVNGVMLQGRIAAYDLFCTLLEREGYVQLAYKHAVSTIQPLSPIDLSSGEIDEDTDVI